MNDDLTARARLRDAAMAVVAEQGMQGFSARKVAARAGVSPGLVAHHFGSMDGLLAACDHHVAGAIREEKSAGLNGGLTGMDFLAAGRNSPTAELLPYLARRLSHGDAPRVAQLVDELIADAVDYLRTGEAAGYVTPSEDPTARAAYVTLSALGLVALSSHVERHLAVDLTSSTLGEDAAVARFMTASFEVYAGMFSPALLAMLQDQLKEK